MMKNSPGETYMSEMQLRALANQVVQTSGATQAQIAHDLDVAQPTVSQALRGRANRRYTDLLIRIIERYSDYRVEGPQYKISRTAPGES